MHATILLAMVTAKKTHVVIPLISTFLAIALDSYGVIVLTAVISVIGTAVLSLLIALYVRNSSNRIEERKELEDRVSSVETQVAVLEQHKGSDGQNSKPKTEN